MDEFMAAVEEGDIETAKELYPDARRPWERIEPVAAAFGDLDPALDAREGDVPKDTWGGWHYFEKTLWIEESTEGLEPYIEESTADAETLVEAAETVEFTPPEIAQGAVDLLGEVSASKITGEEERYSHTDLWDFEANVEGSEEAFEAVAPLLDDPELEEEVTARFADVYAGLDAYRDGDGFVLYTELDKGDTRKLSQQIDALAEPLSQVAGQLG
jgi:iron uptake system component EfeO